MSKFRVLELKGIKSLRALNAFHTLMLGLKMLPAYLGESYESFFSLIESLSDEEKLKFIKEAALFVELQKDEIEALCSFVADANGIPINANSIKNFGPEELFDIITSVCFEISKIKIDFITESEKKN